MKIEYLDVIDVIEPWKYLENIELDSLRLAYENIIEAKSTNLDQVYCIVSTWLSLYLTLSYYNLLVLSFRLLFFIYINLCLFTRNAVNLTVELMS